jgi:NDP-sugar pyrophosphorylase family protein
VDSFPIRDFSSCRTEVVAVDVKAILIVAPPAEDRQGSSAELVGGMPLAFADVLGRPMLYRIADRLAKNGIQPIAVISESAMNSWPTAMPGEAGGVQWTQASAANLWKAAEHVFTEFVQTGADAVLVWRVGAYAEFDVDEFLQFHVDNQAHVTAMADADGAPLDICMIAASRRNDAAYALRHQLHKFRGSSATYYFEGFCNRLRESRDLRQLAVDSLQRLTDIEPVGSEIRPGVWLGKGARVHRRARVLSPAFIGSKARVRASAVVTRCTSLEHHSVVDCGTVVEDVSVLPYSYLGAGLDVSHSVVGFRRLWNLPRSVEVEISDAKLVGMASTNAPLRALASAASLVSFVPAQILRGLFAPSQRGYATSLPEAMNEPCSALNAPASLQASAPSVDAGEFPANLVAARRYGNE